MFITMKVIELNQCLWSIKGKLEKI